MAKIRLYLDECVDVQLAYRLRNHGYDALSVRDVGNLGKKDEEQLEYAINDKRAIFTHNVKHFKHLHKDFVLRQRYHYGIIVSKHLDIDELERRILNLLRYVTHSQIGHQLVKLSQFK